MVVVLGQSSGGSPGGTSGGVFEAVIWIMVLVVCCVVLGVVLMRIRKHFFSEEESGSAGVLPVAELRRLRDRGELSDEEYRRALDVLAGRAMSGGVGGGVGGGSSGVSRETSE